MVLGKYLANAARPQYGQPPFHMTGAFHLQPPPPDSPVVHNSPECDSHGHLDEEDVSRLLTNGPAKEGDERGEGYISSVWKRARGKTKFVQGDKLFDIESSSIVSNSGEHSKQGLSLVSRKITLFYLIVIKKPLPPFILFILPSPFAGPG